MQARSSPKNFGVPFAIDSSVHSVFFLRSSPSGSRSQARFAVRFPTDDLRPLSGWPQPGLRRRTLTRSGRSCILSPGMRIPAVLFSVLFACASLASGQIDIRSKQLAGADLRRADLRRAELRDANLRHADLERADLSDADLREADLRSANFYSADLTVRIYAERS